MSTIGETTIAPPVAAYARRGVSAGITRRRWFVPAVVVAGAVGLLLVASSSGWLRGLLGNSGAKDAGLYVVKPMDVAITLSEDGELKPKKSVEVKCEVEGQSTILFVVPESTHVKKGELLVELASNELTEKIESEDIELRRIMSDVEAAREELEIQRQQNASDIKKAEIDLQVAELELKKYLEGDFHRDQKTIEIDIARDEAQIGRTQEELDKHRKLLERHFVSESKVKEIEFELDNAKRTLQKDKLALDILRSYEKSMNEMKKSSDFDRAREELERVKRRASSREAQAVAKLEQSQAQLNVRQSRFNRMKEQLGKTKIYSPAEGVVQYASGEGGRWGNDEERIAPGMRTREGQTLIVLPDTSQMVVTTRIHEADRHQVHEGLPCIVRAPAVPGKTFTGRIASIAKFADSANRWLNPDLKEHTTEILLDETNAPLSPGDSAEIKILVDTLEDVLAVPVQSVFTRGRKSFVFVSRGREPEAVEVELGRSNTNLVEIRHGLADGDTVLMQADERLLAKLPAAGAAETQPPGFPEGAPRRNQGADGGRRNAAAGGGGTGGGQRQRRERPVAAGQTSEHAPAPAASQPAVATPTDSGT